MGCYLWTPLYVNMGGDRAGLLFVDPLYVNMGGEIGVGCYLWTPLYANMGG